MPDTKITWGPAIPTPNVRPSWLLDTETVVDIKTNNGCRCSDGGAGAPPYQWSWKVIKAIRLPADHAYYLATDKGFTYGPGGESAPEDYDGGEIIYRSGSVQPSARFLSWEHTPGRTRLDPEYAIIGYQPQADRKSVVSGKCVSVRVDLGGRRILTKTSAKYLDHNEIILWKLITT